MRPSTHKNNCCRRWTPFGRRPTLWKALWPTTCGRCPPTRRCCTSSEVNIWTALYSGREVCVLVESAADGEYEVNSWDIGRRQPIVSARNCCDNERAL